jgi:hypothetical protein
VPVLERQRSLYAAGVSSPAPLSYHYYLRKHTIKKLRLRGAPAAIVPLRPCLPRRRAVFAMSHDSVVHGFHENAIGAKMHN